MERRAVPAFVQGVVIRREREQKDTEKQTAGTDRRSFITWAGTAQICVLSPCLSDGLML